MVQRSSGAACAGGRPWNYPCGAYLARMQEFCGDGDSIQTLNKGLGG